MQHVKKHHEMLLTNQHIRYVLLKHFAQRILISNYVNRNKIFVVQNRYNQKDYQPRNDDTNKSTDKKWHNTTSTTI